MSHVFIDFVHYNFVLLIKIFFIGACVFKTHYFTVIEAP